MGEQLVKKAKMTYLQKLSDPRWQKRRLEIFERDKWTCQLCGETKMELHVHHLMYQGEPWEADDWQLETLCKGCHWQTRPWLDMEMASIMKSMGSTSARRIWLLMETFSFAGLDSTNIGNTLAAAAMEGLRSGHLASSLAALRLGAAAKDSADGTTTAAFFVEQLLSARPEKT